MAHIQELISHQVGVFICVLFIGLPLRAGVPDDVQFHDLFMSALAGQTGDRESLHSILDGPLREMLKASTIDQAMQLATSSSLASVVKGTQSGIKTPYDVNAILRQHPVTLVIVPGIFGEFIPNRAFEEILSRDSVAKKDFAERVKAAQAQTYSVDSVYSLHEMRDLPVALDQVVNVASLDQQGQPILKIVLLFTPYASLETLVDVGQQADIFNRRLQKYLQLSSDSDVVLVGYSRGVTTALQMVSQARGQDWIRRVKGVVALGGVVFGSTLSDNLKTPNSTNAQMVAAVQNLLASLQPLPPDAGAVEKTELIANNSLAWAKFVKDVAVIEGGGFDLQAQNLDTSGLIDPSHTVQLSLDFGGVVKTILQMGHELGLDHPMGDYSNNIVRFKQLVGSALVGVLQLSTEARVAWWQSHQVPTNGIRYYGLAAAMPDPDTSDFEKSLWNNPLSFNQSYDDFYLLASHRKYVEMSHVSLNDSQVAVPQVQFLPQVIAMLNPAQAPLSSASLGILTSHHWGLALQVVNEMRDRRRNPFPREAMLKALAAKVILDGTN